MGFFESIFSSIVSSFGSSDTEWFCDGCHAKLNEQSGFTTDYSTWECSECGDINDVTDNNLYDSHEDYQAAMGIPPCPACGGIVQGDAPDATAWFNCGGCGERWHLEGGELISPFDRSRRSSGHTCLSCQRELRGSLTSAWEDGDNASAYVRCESCGGIRTTSRWAEALDRYLHRHNPDEVFVTSAFGHFITLLEDEMEGA